MHERNCRGQRPSCALVVRLLVKDTNYGDVEEETEDTIIKYMDDNRFSFCNNDFPTAYF